MTESFTRIDPGDELGKKLQFTKDKFRGYLTLVDNTVYISAIESRKPGRHNLTYLFNRITSLGYTIKVPSPFPKMESIVRTKGFVRTTEYSPELQVDIDVWVKEP